MKNNKKILIRYRKLLRNNSTPAERIAIELDGGYHNTPRQSKKDKERDLILKSYGIKVLRFRNELVFKDSIRVLETIRNEFNPDV